MCVKSPKLDQRGIVALATHVIIRAAEDLEEKDLKIKNSAKLFFSANSEALDFWAGIAGFDPDAIRYNPKIKKLVS